MNHHYPLPVLNIMEKCQGYRLLVNDYISVVGTEY